MAAIPPIPQFIDLDSSGVEVGVATLADFGTVEAATVSSELIFHLWNNRGNSTAVADMINVDLTVRDASGQTTDQRICGQVDGIVFAQFYDYSKGASGQWGINTGSGVTMGAWQADTGAGTFPASPIGWKGLKFDINLPVISASGAYRKLEGKANTANVVADRANYAVMKFKLYAQPLATAGQVDWIIRASYQYN